MENTLEECLKETEKLKEELNRKNNEIENLKKKSSFLAKAKAY